MELKEISYNLNKNKEIKDQLINWVSPYFKKGDCLATLTYRPDVDNSLVKCSHDVECFLNRLNRTIYGKQADNRKNRPRTKRLNCFSVFEKSRLDEVHIHLLLERPVDCSRYKGGFDKLIIDTWYQLKRSGNKNAQDVRPLDHVLGVIAYLTKQITSRESYQNFDFNNCSFGTRG
jgi:hypothetical protein